MRALFDVPAPAKLNLFLHIVGQRADGYHLLQSAFMLIDWCDSLHFEIRPGGQITRQVLEGPPLPDDDLIVRAAHRLQQISACPLGAHIGVHKRIPAQAGLGGGSSNAATTLLALNRLWQLGLSRQQLADIGLELGADVPFFIHGHNAWIEGVGERAQPLDLPPARFVVLKPQQGLSTAAIFKHPALKRNTEPATISVFAANPYDFGQNDLQPVAGKLCKQLDTGLDLLERQNLRARMTGSGSAVFARVPDDSTQADDLKTSDLDLPEGWIIRVCNNLPIHPLTGWAD